MTLWWDEALELRSGADWVKGHDAAHDQSWDDLCSMLASLHMTCSGCALNRDRKLSVAAKIKVKIPGSSFQMLTSLFA